MSLFRRKSQRFLGGSRKSIDAEEDSFHNLVKKRSLFLPNPKLPSYTVPIMEDCPSPLFGSSMHMEPVSPTYSYHSYHSYVDQPAPALRRPRRRMQKKDHAAVAHPKIPENHTIDVHEQKVTGYPYSKISAPLENPYILDEDDHSTSWEFYEMLSANKTAPQKYIPNRRSSYRGTMTITNKVQAEMSPVQQHSRSSSASSANSSGSFETAQTDMSDLQFDFGFNKESAYPGLFPEKESPEVNIVQIDSESESSEHTEDVISAGSLTDDFDSDDYVDDDAVIFEEGEAVEMSIRRIYSPRMVMVGRTFEL